jgi:hypothetical protein
LERAALVHGAAATVCGAGGDAAALAHGPAMAACGARGDAATLVHGPAAVACDAGEDAAAATCVSGGGRRSGGSKSLKRWAWMWGTVY